MFSRRQFLKLTGWTAGAGVLGAFDAFAIEPRFALITQHWHIRHPHWPASAKPLRIGILADIHAIEPYMPPSRIAAIVHELNRQSPDIIFLLGDYVGSLSRFPVIEVPVSEWSPALASLNAPLGIYAVLGNHDWWTGSVPEIRRTFYKEKIELLENRAVKISRNGFEFWVAGLGDQLARGKRGFDDLPGTMRRIKDDAPVILLAHEPDIFVRVPSRVTLTLAGHTHGGQVYIPFIGRPVTGSNYGQRFAYGHLIEQDRHLVVSAGLGLSVAPVRFLVPPEITMVTLSAAKA
jgi:predicted MPP superfamily phosphohydrolase